MAENVVIGIHAQDNAGGVIDNLAKRLKSLFVATNEVDKTAQQLSKTMKNSADIMSTGETRAQLVARGMVDWKKSMEDLNTTMASASKQTDNLAKSQVNLLSSLGKFALGVTGVTLGLQSVGRFMQESVKVATEYQTKLIGLQTIANNFGISQTEIGSAIQELTRDGLLTQADAAEALTSVMSSYVTDVGQAVNAVKMFEDFAASGGKSTIDFSQKVKNLSESFLTQMSMLGNNSGLQENWNEIIKIGEQVTGKKYDAMSKLDQQTIKLAGLTAVHARAEGALGEYMKTNVGTLASYKTQVNTLQLQIGGALVPVLSMLAGSFNASGSGGQVLIGAMRGIASVALGLIVIMRTLATQIGQIFSNAKAFFTGGLEGLKQQVVKNRDEMMGVWEEGQLSLKKIWGDAGEVMKNTLGSVPGWAEEAGNGAKKAMQKMLEDLKKENDRYQREVAKREDDFKRSLAELVWAHQDKKASLEKDLREETESYKKENAERLKDFNETIAEMERSHLRKVRDANQDVVDENEDYAITRAKILQEIQDEERKGIYMFGIWNSQADQQRLAELRARLAEEDLEHQRALEKLQQKLADENEDYTLALEEKKMTFEEETQKAKEEHDKRVSDTQAQLDAETAILNTHKDVVAGIKEVMREDDIARLIRQHNEEKIENERAHLERLEDIKKQASESSGAWKSNFTDPVKKQAVETRQLTEQEFQKIVDMTKPKGEQAGTGWIEGLVSGLKRKWEEWKAAGIQEALAMMGGPLPAIGAFLSRTGIIKQHGGLVPGKTDEPVPMILHGGERVVPRSGTDVNSTNLGSGVTINMYGAVSMRSDADVKMLAEDIIKLIGRRNELERLGVGY